MQQEITRNIAVVNDMLDWVEQNKPEFYELHLLQLIEMRRRLMSVYRALENNASIAVVGEVHSGKSYLIHSLLQDNNHQFRIKANDGEYNFSYEINPLPHYHLSTGVITRFTSYNSNPQRYNPGYPVVARLLSVTDIVVILCQAYYEGIRDYSCPSEQTIENKADLIFRSFHALPKQKEPLVRAEDVLTIRAYLKEYIPATRAFTEGWRMSFFDKVAMVAERIPSDEWLSSVFSVLWDNNPEFDRLYTRLVTILGRMDFAKEIYLPINAVLHHGIDSNTILSGTNFHDLFNDNVEYVSDVYVRKGDDFQQIGTLGKNMLWAVCKEVVFKVEEKNVCYRRNYSMEDITQEVRERLNANGFAADFLLRCDLLDFPGLYTRPYEDLRHLKEDDIIFSSIYNCTKTNYLFNIYNKECQISTLLFCNSFRRNSVPDLWIRLKEWVDSNIGRTPQERTLTLSHTGGVSPLFNICTMFNIDMDESRYSAANEREALDSRWYDRFEKALYREYFHADDVEWVKNWTHLGESFKNSYLLRDFKYSGEMASGLYFGFATEGCEQKLIISKTFYDTLRDSFCNNVTTNLLFENPALSWDVATTRNNDGSLHILEKLNTLSPFLCKEREKKYIEQMEGCRSKINMIASYYKNKEKA